MSEVLSIFFHGNAEVVNINLVNDDTQNIFNVLGFSVWFYLEGKKVGWYSFF